MATLNLGRIKPVFRGAYAGGTAYVVDDIVTSGDETFICIQASTGNATSNASYWTKLAAKGTDGTNLGTTLTTQGDILIRDGSGLARLGYGTSGQVLQTGGSGANPSWIDASSGKIGAISAGYLKTTVTLSSSSADASIGLSASITPTKAGSSILVWSNVTSGGDSGTAAGYHFALYRNINSAGNSKLTAAHGNAAGSRNTAFLSGAQESGGGTWVTQSSSNAYIDTPTYTLGNAIVYEIQGGGAGGTYRHVNRSARDSNGNDDSRNMSSIILMEVLA